MEWINCVIFLSLIFGSSSSGERQKRTLIFPPTSLYGTFVAIAVPVDIPDKNVFVSYNFENNVAPVTNITEIDEVLFPNLPIITARHSRSITRELAYTVLETRFKEHGMNGRECLLRNICEAAETPLHHNGLLGHIMHIIFTPSASKEEGLDDDYYEAELDGLRGDCDKYLEACPFSLFDVITQLVEIIPTKNKEVVNISSKRIHDGNKESKSLSEINASLVSKQEKMLDLEHENKISEITEGISRLR